MIESMLYALGALLEHLHLLVAESHVVEHYEEVVHVSPAALKINGVHDPVGLLQEVERALELVLLDECVGALVQLCQNNWNFVFRHAELLVVVLVEKFIFLVLGRVLHSAAQGVVNLVHRGSLELAC